MADPGKNLNTGDNGFPLNGQKQTFDVGASDATAVSKTGPGYGPYVKGVDVNKSYQDSNGKPKDLSAPTKTTLAQYLSRLTMGKEGSDPTNPPHVGNTYPVGDGSLTLNTVSTSDEKGFPAALENPVKNPAAFTGNDETTWDYTTQQYPKIQSLIKKGKSSVPSVDGNDLLAGVTGTGTSVASDPSKRVGDAPQQKTTSVAGHSDTSAKIINPYTSAVLSQNRFTNANAAFAQVADITDPGPGYDPSLTVQAKLGEWDAQGTNSKSYSTGRLATIGPLLGLRATTTLGATSPGADPNSAGMEAAALLPGLAQLGTATIDQHVLQAKDILASLTNDEVPSSNVLSIGTQSWGQLNDTNDPFDGTNALGMVTLTLALVAGVQVILGALGVLLGLVTPQTKVAQRDGVGRYAVGEYFPTSKPPNSVSGGGPFGAISALASLNFGALLGINPTVYPLSQAMNSGLAAFYGLPQPSGGGISFSIGLSTVTDSPGFLVTFSRSIIRGFVVIGHALSRIGGNPMNVINSVLSMIDTIRNSKVVSAINVWATLGDQILTLPSQDTDTSAAGGTKFSEQDGIDDALSNAMSKNRLRGSLKLAWASNRSRANMLMPTAIMTAAGALTGLGQFDHFAGAPQDGHSLLQTTAIPATNNGRIDPTTAAAFEATLDAEYVPFYFHDLRTNEMVGFHAFLASLTDDFNAGYEKTEGYGRVEPVKIYKSTERRVGMSFYVVATSEPDFDEMWIKINKLVTLVYPQYTKGVSLSDSSGNYSFTQPFSQLIGASPLIRIRLGNLLSSNYSQFALARLFGLGNPDFKVNSYTYTDGDPSVIQNYQTQLQNILQNPNGESYYVAPGTYPLHQDSTGGAPSISIGGPPGPSFAPAFQPHRAHLADLFMVKAQDILNPNNSSSQDPGVIVCTVAVNDDPKFQATYGQSSLGGGKSAISAATDEYQNTDKLIRQVIGGKYEIPAKALIPTNKTKTGVIQSLSLSSTGASDLADFLSTTNNAIAKSFSDTGGKGLAGFIENMSFDWYDKVTWELHSDRVAPKLCKVTLTFSPIHDISPGIDHLGYNRAPVYPVGPFAPSYVTPGASST